MWNHHTALVTNLSGSSTSVFAGCLLTIWSLLVRVWTLGYVWTLGNVGTLGRMVPTVRISMVPILASETSMGGVVYPRWIMML